MQLPEFDLDQWLNAVLWRWINDDVEKEDVRAEVFDLMELPPSAEELESLTLYFDEVFGQFARQELTTEGAVARFLGMIETSRHTSR